MNSNGRRSGAFFVMLSLCLFATAAATLTSCKARYKAAKVKEERKPEDKSAPDLQSLIEQNSFSSNSFTAKASVKTLSGDGDNSFNISLRMRTDSAVWLSISPLLGIEVARVLLTRDSVKLIDRLNNKYAVTDYNYLNDMYRINIDFDIIQGVLTGNLFSYKKNKFNSVYLEDRYYILSTLSKKKLKRSLEDTDVNKPIVQDMWVDASSYRIIKLNIEDQRTGKSLQTDYSDHRQTEGGLFPFKSKTTVAAEKQLKVDIEYNRLTVNASTDFPFSIPSSFEKIN
jgi:hypothetical protein